MIRYLIFLMSVLIFCLAQAGLEDEQMVVFCKSKKSEESKNSEEENNRMDLCVLCEQLPKELQEMIWGSFSSVDFIDNGAKFNKTCIRDYKDDGKMKLTFEEAFDSVFNKRYFSDKNNPKGAHRHVFFSELKCSELRRQSKQYLFSNRLLESAKGSNKLFACLIQSLKDSGNIGVSVRDGYSKKFIFEELERIISIFETENHEKDSYFTSMHVFTNYKYYSYRYDSEGSECLADKGVDIRVGRANHDCIYGVYQGDVNKIILAVDEGQTISIRKHCRNSEDSNWGFCDIGFLNKGMFTDNLGSMLYMPESKHLVTLARDSSWAVWNLGDNKECGNSEFKLCGASHGFVSSPVCTRQEDGSALGIVGAYLGQDQEYRQIGETIKLYKIVPSAQVTASGQQDLSMSFTYSEQSLLTMTNVNNRKEFSAAAHYLYGKDSLVFSKLATISKGGEVKIWDIDRLPDRRLLTSFVLTKPEDSVEYDDLYEDSCFIETPISRLLVTKVGVYIALWEQCGDDYKQVDIINMGASRIASVSERTYGKIIISFMNGCILLWDRYSVVKSNGVNVREDIRESAIKSSEEITPITSL
ncbi:MAG: hypothetical protein QS748_07910 [Candidatus Endonucleobacter bathymodioli]|uniref:Uncharacterized protein n=1 Tax=Candidatus Endonucleibacter bathymodioli TaxID=539814 RepID=A0AA90NM78_9GAMM|nr:hypothetical protein [Candidatus Endonucleobacter bathymodioli]